MSGKPIIVRLREEVVDVLHAATPDLNKEARAFTSSSSQASGASGEVDSFVLI